MSTLAVKGSMLYCPKCETKYEAGSQRFCDNDGGRLQPAPEKSAGGSPKKTKVFTSLLRQSPTRSDRDETLAKTPRFTKARPEAPNFEPPKKSTVFTTESTLEVPSAEPRKRVPSPTVIEVKEGELPTKRVESSEIASGTAEVKSHDELHGDRSELTWQNPRALLGQTVKGRYRVADILHQDQTSIAYLAEDGIVKGKRVVVRVLMNKSAKETFRDGLFADERVSLSHINHPNVVRAVDFGELPDGKPVVITDYVEGKSVGDVLNSSGHVNPMRTARIIRQASLALSEVHENAILHRNLKPEHILLMVSDAGVEQVKVTDFSVSDGKPRIDNLGYKSPEQLGRQLPTYASDAYSLAVIAYEMLTGQKPFNSKSEGELLRAQKAGLKVNASDLRSEVPEIVDEILAKGLSYNPTERYGKARDFGEALFNALTTASPWEEKDVEAEIERSAKFGNSDKEVIDEAPAVVLPDSDAIKKSTSSISSDIHIASTDPVEIDVEGDTEEEKSPRDVTPETSKELWKNRSPEGTKERGWFWTFISVLGLLALLAGTTWLLYYLYNRSEQNVAVAPQENSEMLESEQPTIKKGAEDESADGIETPPQPRQIEPRENSNHFENSREKLSPALAKKFRGFSLYYPKSWNKAEAGKSNFLDIKSETKDGLPKEQMIVTSYDSDGTFSADQENFPKLVEKSNKDLSGILPSYKVDSEGKITVNNGWKAYEVKFTSKAETAEGKPLEVWGRRIWIPAARPGVKNGIVITMLATSLSEEVKSLDDVGIKGELADILETFEPDQSYD